MVSTREISIPGPHPPPSLMTTWCAWRGHGARRRPRPVVAVTLLRSPALPPLGVLGARSQLGCSSTARQLTSLGEKEEVCREEGWSQADPLWR